MGIFQLIFRVIKAHTHTSKNEVLRLFQFSTVKLIRQNILETDRMQYHGDQCDRPVHLQKVNNCVPEASPRAKTLVLYAIAYRWLSLEDDASIWSPCTRCIKWYSFGHLTAADSSQAIKRDPATSNVVPLTFNSCQSLERATLFTLDWWPLIELSLDLHEKKPRAVFWSGVLYVFSSLG